MHTINISPTTVQHMCNWKGIQILTICLISKGLLFFYTPCIWGVKLIENYHYSHYSFSTHIIVHQTIVCDNFNWNSCMHGYSILYTYIYIQFKILFCMALLYAWFLYCPRSKLSLYMQMMTYIWECICD
jgi:hypothetical protein